MWYVPLRAMKHFRAFLRALVLFARNFERSKTPRESILAAYDCRLWRTGRPHRPCHEHASISRAVVLHEEL